MNKHFIIYLVMALLMSCTNRNVVEIHLPNQTVIPVQQKPIDTEAVAKDVENERVEKLVAIKPQAGNPYKENTDELCPTFVLPILIPIPPLPAEIVTKKKITDSELIDLLANHVVDLKRTSNKNREKVYAEYSKYLERCKK